MKIKLNAQQSVPSAARRLGSIIAFSVMVGALVGILTNWKVVPLVAWDTLALTYIVSTWRRILKFDAALVKLHALREDPSRTIADLILIVASIASLIAVGILLVGSKTTTSFGQISSAGLSVVSVVVSWLLIHTIFTLHYAELYYTHPEGGIEFGTTEAPIYIDFAYLAFTVGMTYQVSDTNLNKRKFRTAVLRQALLSFVFGTIIVATTINLVAGLGK